MTGNLADVADAITYTNRWSEQSSRDARHYRCCQLENNVQRAI